MPPLLHGVHHRWRSCAVGTLPCLSKWMVASTQRLRLQPAPLVQTLQLRVLLYLQRPQASTLRLQSCVRPLLLAVQPGVMLHPPPMSDAAWSVV